MQKSLKEQEARFFANKLYDRLKEQHLAGVLTFRKDDLSISLSISDYQFDIGQDYIGVNKKCGRIFLPITHWHPDDEEIFDEVCNIGKSGNVTVIYDGWFGKAVLYIGSQKDSPYKRKWLFGRYHYIYAE